MPLPKQNFPVKPSILINFVPGPRHFDKMHGFQALLLWQSWYLCRCHVSMQHMEPLASCSQTLYQSLRWNRVWTPPTFDLRGWQPAMLASYMWWWLLMSNANLLLQFPRPFLWGENRLATYYHISWIHNTALVIQDLGYKAPPRNKWLVSTLILGWPHFKIVHLQNDQIAKLIPRLKLTLYVPRLCFRPFLTP